MAFYFQLFWIPAVASVLLLVLLWAQNELAGRAAWLLGGWFLLALAAQYLAPTTGAWIVGLALQTALAIFLLLKQQLGRP